MDLTQIIEWLDTLSNPEVLVGMVGALLAWIAGLIPAFESLNVLQKRLAFVLAAGAIPVLGTFVKLALMNNVGLEFVALEEVLEAISAWAVVVAGGAITYSYALKGKSRAKQKNA